MHTQHTLIPEGQLAINREMQANKMLSEICKSKERRRERGPNGKGWVEQEGLQGTFQACYVVNTIFSLCLAYRDGLLSPQELNVCW